MLVGCSGQKKLRKGFKTEAESISLEVRRELQLAGHHPLNPWLLARHLEIDVIPLSKLSIGAPQGVKNSVKYFQKAYQSYLSAFTVQHPGQPRLIVHNDSHALTRQRSNIAHELAHALLHHPNLSPLNELGKRQFDPIIEEEATWLGGALLLPRLGAMWAVNQGFNLRNTARYFQISPSMARYRLNVTGAAAKLAGRARS